MNIFSSHIFFFFLIIWVDIWVEARVHILRLIGVILLPYYYKSCLRGFCCVPRPKLICGNSFCFLCSCPRVAFSHRQRRTGPGAGTCGGHTIGGGLGWLLPRLFQEWHCPVRPCAASLFSRRGGGQSSQRRCLFIIVLGNEARALSKVDKDLLSHIPWAWPPQPKDLAIVWHVLQCWILPSHGAITVLTFPETRQGSWRPPHQASSSFWHHKRVLWASSFSYKLLSPAPESSWLFLWLKERDILLAKSVGCFSVNVSISFMRFICLSFSWFIHKTLHFIRVFKLFV